jgi:hypothetical protein
MVTVHPHYKDMIGRLPYSRDPHSTAYAPHGTGRQYYIGAFYGGRRKKVIRFWQVLAHNIREDMNKNVMVEVHEESHLNRYAIDHPELVELYPPFFTAEGMNYPLDKVLLEQVNKDYSCIRGDI